MHTTQEQLDQFHLPLYNRLPIVADHGEGCTLYDSDGNAYLDMLAGIAVDNTGHCHPTVVKAIQEQAAKLLHVSNLFYIKPQGELAERLVKHSGLDRVFFCNSGAEANEGAIKFARNYAAKKGKQGPIVSFEHCFHGRTIANLALGKEDYQKGFEPMPDGFHKLPLNDKETLHTFLKETTPIAFIIEIIQGEGGINVVEEDFIKEIASICEEHDILLICDEIQAGYGRSGKFFAYQHFDLSPDIVTCAKGMGSGTPIGGVITKQKVADTLQPGQHGTTFGGGPLVCAAAVATLDVIEKENLVEAAERKGKYFQEKLKEKVGDHPVVAEIRGKGLMIGVALKEPGKEVVTAMLKRKVIGNCASGNVMRFVPPLIVKEEELDRAAEVLLESLNEVFK